MKTGRSITKWNELLLYILCIVLLVFVLNNCTVHVHWYWKDGWMSLMSLRLKQVPNRHGNKHTKWANVHLWHRMKQLFNKIPSVSWLVIRIEPRTQQVVVQQSTTRLSGPRIGTGSLNPQLNYLSPHPSCFSKSDASLQFLFPSVHHLCFSLFHHFAS